MTATITYKGHTFDCDYTFHKGSTPLDRDEEPVADSVEVVAISFQHGSDDLTVLLADVGWLPEIEKLILENI